MTAADSFRRAKRALLAAGLAASLPGALAATATTTFQVTASVATQCTVTAADLLFGPVNPLGADVDQTTSVTVRCTKNTPYTVGPQTRRPSSPIRSPSRAGRDASPAAR